MFCKANPEKLIIEAIAVVFKDERARLGIKMKAAGFAFESTAIVTSADAAVCARGVRGAACAGPRGAVAVRRPVPVCRMVVVNGVAVRRCV